MKRNADSEEIEKFAAMAARWWDPEGDMKPLHRINPLRMGYIKKHAGDLQDKRVLDIGCGGGLLTEALHEAGARATGADLTSAILEAARMHARDNKRDIDYREESAEDLAEEMPESFDVVTCLEMLEHVPDPSSIVRACARLTRPGGRIFFSTLNRNPKSWLFGIIGAEYVLRLLPRGTHQYAKFIRPSELERWVRRAHLHCEDITGMHYNPLFQTGSLVPDVSVNYLMYCRKPA